LEAGRVLSPEARDAVDNFLGSFDLLYSLDAYRGGARAVVDAIAAHLPTESARRSDAEENRALLLRGPRSLVDGLVNAFLLWTNPIELDASKLEVRDGAVDVAAVPAGKLRATVVARSATQARYAEAPAPMGLTRYLQSFGFLGTPSYEKAMLLEAMDPAKRSEDLTGSQPLIVALEGEFPSYSGARDARALLDAVRRITSGPWLGGPLAFDDDVDAPVFETSGGWKRTSGGAPWTLEDLGTLARALKEKGGAATLAAADSSSSSSSAASNGATASAANAPSAEAPKPGRFLVVPNLHFATSAGMGLVAQATQNRELSSPLLQRLLDVALYGSETRYQGFDQRARDARRRLVDFQREETRSSPEHRAAELWRETLLGAAASSTYFEGEAEERTAQGGTLGLQVQSDPLGRALERLLSGEREAVLQGDDPSTREKRGLDGVVLDIEDGIVARAEARETWFRLIGVFAAPLVLLALLVASMLFGWLRYR
ncbi:MAG: hypothetical protein JNM84_18330, partial [Planctomycetes bacterium]|nr:hypothetical protein [Planctomycetota bacterium]